MKRRLFRILSTASLALCVVAAAMWLRGRFGNDLLTWTTGAGDTLVALRSGERLDLTVARDWPGGHRPLTWTRLPRGTRGEGASWPTGNARVETLFGLRVWRAQGWFGDRVRYPRPPTYPITTIGIGWDTLALLGAILPSARLAARLYRRHTLDRRAAAGQCVHCGYDLRASRDRCPECGSIVPPSLQSAERTPADT